MPYQVLVEEIETEPGEAVLIHYLPSLKKLVVTIEYDNRVLTEHPVLYWNGLVAYDMPNRITLGTREACEYIMRTMRAAATGGDWNPPR